MKERPILFSAPMIRAILDGSKTQTRRIADIPPDAMAVRWSEAVETFPKGDRYTGWVVECPQLMPLVLPRTCPHGIAGDRLWVRETWAISEPHPTGDDDPRELPEDWGRLSETTRAYWLRRLAYRATAPDADVGKWRPSIHMPRWASRIDLEITGVRVERVQDISEEDAKAEGVTPVPGAGGALYPSKLAARRDGTHRDAFADLWRSINGAESWDANPWVWVLDFKRVKP